MSSHHIVREKQEPALMVANGEACSLELLGELLEWSPYVLALDGALPRLLTLGIKVDAVLGDFDSMDVHSSELTQLQDGIRVLHRPDQEKTDFEKGLDFLLEEGHKSVNILWATGYRLDHTYANLSNLNKYVHALSINVIDDHIRLYPLPKQFRKHFPKAQVLSLMPMGRVEGIRTSNLLYPLQDEVLEIGSRIGTSNQVVETGWVEIHHQSGLLLLGEVRN